MEMKFDLGLEVDEGRIEHGGKMPAGWYVATIEDIFPDKDGNLKIGYKITDGIFSGGETSQTIWDPDNSEDEDKRKKAQQALLHVAGHLGCREANSSAYDFSKAVGAKVAIRTAYKTERYCTSCDTPPEKYARKCKACGGNIATRDLKDEFANVASYDGSFLLTHPKLTEMLEQYPKGSAEVRKAVGMADAPATGGGGGTKKPTAKTGKSASPTASTVAVPSVTREQRLAAATEDI